MPKKPLEGIRVISFTWYIAGPQIDKILAAFGAEVIRIEGRSRPDPLRPLGPFRDGTPALNRGGIFNEYNTSKLSVALNLAKPKGVEVAKKIISQADMVIENYSGGALKKMGLGYEELKKLKPDIIMLSSCMMGQTGPYASLPGAGPHLTNLSGFGYIAGWPDRESVSLGVYTDYIAHRFSLAAVLAAIAYRRRTGKGQYLDMSQYEGGVQFLAPLLLDYAVNQRVVRQVGNRNNYAAPHGAYRCYGEDRWCAIAVFTDEEWTSFCKVIGNPAWTTDTRFSTLEARKDNAEELDKIVEEWTTKYSAEEVMIKMQAAGVGAGIVETNEDLMDKDPQVKYRQLFWEFDHPEVGKYRASGSAYKLSKVSYEMRRAPLLGEHNEYICREILKMSDEEISQLIAEGIIE